ncbi:MAG: cryptochrome/photolyase family protein [Flavobacteriaceae bacterium]
MEIRLILGDQLNEKHLWFTELKDDVCYVMFEMRQETDYVKHHIQKVVAFFAAMRSFARQLEEDGHHVLYYTIDDPNNAQSLQKNIEKVINLFSAKKFAYQLPDEYRLDEQLEAIATQLEVPTKTYDTKHFLTTRDELKTFYEGKKSLVMEFFYRYMRKKHHYLMINGQPEGGSWNYDKFNRNTWKGGTIPPPYKPDASLAKKIYPQIKAAGISTIGKFNEDEFLFATTRKASLAQLDYFCEHLLQDFGTYQDAMHQDETNFFHARISFSLNVKLIDPAEVIEHAITAYRKNSDRISLSQIEGFVRQILGWREYIRGLYWKEMPQYKKKNELNNFGKLPAFYWTGKTKMNCLKNSIKNSLEHAYAHHIQRLMITGNFALLLQTNPDEVDDWYLGIYADAVEWVQLPNTRGMSQYADGGILATKPYVSSGSYVNKMSNYCKGCSYDKKQRTGENACPFNSLYWNFLDDKREELRGNNRMGMMYNLLGKINPEELARIKERAYQIMKNPDAF